MGRPGRFLFRTEGLPADSHERHGIQDGPLGLGQVNELQPGSGRAVGTQAHVLDRSPQAEHDGLPDGRLDLDVQSMSDEVIGHVAEELQPDSEDGDVDDLAVANVIGVGVGAPPVGGGHPRRSSA